MSRYHLAAMLFLLAACSSHTAVRYPNHYAEAVVTHSGAAIPSDGANRFVSFFARFDEPDIGDRVDALYAEQIYFSDTMFLTRDRAALRSHFQRMQGAGRRIDVTIDDIVTSGENLYLRWRMHFDIDADGTRRSNTIGMTLLRFDPDGRISFQQDFWDSAEGFYRHVPLLGWGIDSVATRVGAAP